MRILRLPVAWWRGLDPQERVLYRAMVLLAAGGIVTWPPLAFFLPGTLLVLVFFGFSLRRTR
jgi:hypothetical protein